jgi:hypothetical protein
MPTENEIAAAIAKVVAEGRYDGMSGNCARFAIALNHALGDVGEYHYVDGDHSEYADHVLLKVGDVFFDADGASSEADVESNWDGPPEYFGAAGDESTVMRLADDSGAMTAPLDMEALEYDLREALGLAQVPAPTA